MKKILFALVALLGIVACEPQPPVDPTQTLLLSVDKFIIVADGVDVATFTVTDHNKNEVNATILFADTKEALEGNTFKTKYAGEYVFYAKYGDKISNPIGIQATEPADTPEPPVEDTLTLEVDKSEINADGTDKATFTVKWNNNIVDATIYNAANKTPLQGTTFSTTEAGEYKFYAKATIEGYGEATSEEVTVIAKATESPVEGTLTLEVDKSEINADGTDKATFTVKWNNNIVNATIYNAANRTPVQGTTFSTTEAGEYKFYAKATIEGYGEATSEEVTVIAKATEPEQEKPITIEATANTIKANGIDAIMLIVTQDGANVTSQSTIYANGSVINGNKFATTTPGTYVIYATKGSVSSNEITITAEAVENGTTIVFAEGVTISSGWYDVNKKGAGDNGDINMCWAAASANMIQWWQDRYVAAGNTLPSTAINGPGTKTYGSFSPYELALMEMYHDEWDNSRGGHPEEAIPWYFEGKLYGGEYASSGSQAYPLTEGGYWKSVWSSVEPNLYRGYSHDIFPSQYPKMYTYCYNNYYHWGNGSSLQGKERLAYFSNLVVESFERGIASLTIALSENIASLHHSVTIWGYEIDNATGLLTRIWITDSDDLVSEPKQPLLNEYSVSIADGKSHIKLTGNTRYGNAWIVSIHPFSGYGSANK